MEYIFAILVIVLLPAIVYMSYLIMSLPIIFFICTINLLVETFLNINKRLMTIIEPKPKKDILPQMNSGSPMPQVKQPSPQSLIQE